jgi:hypothetical protein
LSNLLIPHLCAFTRFPIRLIEPLRYYSGLRSRHAVR